MHFLGIKETDTETSVKVEKRMQLNDGEKESSRKNSSSTRYLKIAEKSHFTTLRAKRATFTF